MTLEQFNHEINEERALARVLRRALFAALGMPLPDLSRRAGAP